MATQTARWGLLATAEFDLTPASVYAEALDWLSESDASFDARTARTGELDWQAGVLGSAADTDFPGFLAWSADPAGTLTLEGVVVSSPLDSFIFAVEFDNGIGDGAFLKDVILDGVTLLNTTVDGGWF